MRSPDAVTGVIGIIIAVVAALFAGQYGVWKVEKPGPGFLPFAICLILILLNALLIVKDSRNRQANKKIIIGPKWRNIVFLMAASFIYTLLWDVLGFILNTFLLMGFSLKILGRESIIKSIMVAILISIVSYLIFKTYLSIELPAGILNLRF
jgi:putative tricarboxylic transport membrane protein